MYKQNNITVFIFLSALAASCSSYGMEKKAVRLLSRYALHLELNNHFRSNNLAAITALLQSKEIQQDDKNEMLCYAVLNGSPAAIKLILDHGAQASIDNMHEEGNNSLISAVFDNNYGADPLHEKVADKQREENIAATLELLIQRGAALEKKSMINQWIITIADDGLEDGAMQSVGMPPLMQAIYYGNAVAVKRLIELKAAIKATDSRGWTVFDYAELTDSDDIKQFLGKQDIQQYI